MGLAVLEESLPSRISDRGALDLADFEHTLRLDYTGFGTALREKERQKALQHFRVRGIPQEAPFPLHINEVLVLQLLQVMRDGGRLHAEFILDLAGDQSFRMSPQEMIDNSQARLGSQSSQDVGELDEVDGFLFRFQMSPPSIQHFNNAEMFSDVNMVPIISVYAALQRVAIR